jgi:hypothetical protein
MKYNGTIIKKKNHLEKVITDSLKARIKELDLIDTGKMLNTTRCVIDLNDDGFNFDIQSTEYFIFNDNRYDLVDYVFRQKNISELTDDLAGDIVMFYLMED